MSGRHLFDLDIQTSPPIFCSEDDGGGIYVSGILGGSFRGDRLEGEVLPLGGDWARVTSQGTSRLDVQLMLRSRAGGLCTMRYLGRMHASAAVMQRLIEGADVPASDYYMRIAPVFEAHGPEFQWLNPLLAVGHGRLAAVGTLHYAIHEIV